MEKDFYTVKVNNITFHYSVEPITDSLLKNYVNLNLRDEHGNSRAMIWNPKEETIEQKIEGILMSKRWP